MTISESSMESERLQALAALGALNLEPEQEYDDLVALAAEICQTPSAALSFVDRDRVRIKAIYGGSAQEFAREGSLCDRTIASSELFQITDTLEDESFRDSPQVQGPPFVRFYAGVPIIGSAGHPYGSLSVMDTKPRVLTSGQRAGLERVARLATVQLEGAPRKMRFQEAHTRFQAIVKGSLEVAIITTDIDGLVTVFNPGAEKMLGYRADELVGRERASIFHLAEEVEARSRELSEIEGREISGFEVFLYLANKKGSETRQWTYVCKDGQHRQVRLSVSALRHESGELFGYLGVAVDLSEQFAAKEAARLAAERFSGAFGSAVIGMALVSADGRWLEVNDSLCEMFGYRREELLTAEVPPLTHPEDLEKSEQFLARLVSTDLPQHFLEKRYIKRDGSTIWTQISVAPVRNPDNSVQHFVAQIQDITTENEARLALEESETRFRGLFEFSPIGIALNEYETGAFLAVNEALVEPTGYSQEEFVRLSYWDLTPKDYEAQEHQQLELLSSTGRYGPYFKEYIRKDGSRYPVRLRGMLMRDKSGRRVIWSLIEDITESQKTERMKNEFISTVSHELRTPLTSISGALSLIVGGVLGEVPEGMREMLEIAVSNSQRLGLLVDDLLYLNKLLDAKLEVHLEPVELIPLLEANVAEMTGYAEGRGVKIVRKGEQSVGITADPARLTQVITNLLSNACKHSAPGQTVTLQHEVLPCGGVVVSVIDQGSGIPKDFRPRVFQRFAQADSSDSRSLGGTGLGLAICKELVESMNGIIGYESEPGKGAHFWFRLSPSNKPRVSSKSRMIRVLHVEDDQDFSRVLSTQLIKRATLVNASTLTEANALLRREAFDLVLLDLELPDGHGETLWETLKVTQPELPIIILSGHEVPNILACHVAAVLEKNGSAQERVLELLSSIPLPSENQD